MNEIDTKEMISALADGQLKGESLARGLALCQSDPLAAEAWRTYHLIGDVMRSGELARATPPELFLAELSRRLAEEVPPMGGQETVQNQGSTDAANDQVFRWKLMAGLASLAAVFALGWTGMSYMSDQPQLAGGHSAGQAVVAGNDRLQMMRDPRLDELLAAHRQLGGANALQAPAGFLRNATFEGPQR